MEKRFENQHAVVTGAAGDIGFEIALEFANQGLHSIVLADIKKDILEEKTTYINENTNCQAYSYVIDLSKTEAIEPMFEYIGSKLQSIEILVNAAGILTNNTIEDENAEDFIYMLNVNLIAPHLCTREVIKWMVPQKYGKIINIASLACRRGGITASPSYVGSKGGLVAITKNYANKLGKYNINVNAVNPGIIQTQMTNHNDYSAIMNSISLGRLGEPKDISTVVSFLASEDSKYITGNTIEVNGGLYKW